MRFFLFLKVGLYCYKIPSRTAFAASHRFWVIVFSLSFVSRYFLFPLWFLLRSLGYLVAYYLAVMCLYFLHYFPVIDTKSHSIVVRKDTWYNFNFLKFTEAWFVTQNLICPVEYFLSTWEESVFCCFWIECPININ